MSNLLFIDDGGVHAYMLIIYRWNKYFKVKVEEVYTTIIKLNDG